MLGFLEFSWGWKNFEGFGKFWNFAILKFWDFGRLKFSEEFARDGNGNGTPSGKVKHLCILLLMQHDLQMIAI